MRSGRTGDIEGRLHSRLRRGREASVKCDVKDELEVQIDGIESREVSENRLRGLLARLSTASMKATISLTRTSSKMPRGFHRMRDNSFRNRTWAGSFIGVTRTLYTLSPWASAPRTATRNSSSSKGLVKNANTP